MATINCLVTFGSESRVMTFEQGKGEDIITKIHTRFTIPRDYIIKLKRYSIDWQEWVNIEPSEIQNREKIRVETCLQLVDLSVTSNSTFDDTEHCSSRMSSIIANSERSADSFANIFVESTDEDEKVKFLEQSRAESSAEGQPGPSKEAAESFAEGQKGPSKRGTDRVNVQLKPWPLTINIPEENMSPQLRACLQQGNFPSYKQQKQLVQVIFDYMWQFGSYPSRYQYEVVAQQLVMDYPCLAQTEVPSAKPYDYWKMKISDKFRNERRSLSKDDIRIKKPRKELERILHPSAASTSQLLPGEDEESIRMHTKWMQDEFKKKSPDWQRVKKLMGITFQQRREDVAKKILVAQLREKYPFQFTATEICNEFERMTGIKAVESITKNLKSFIEPILGFVFPSNQQEAEHFRAKAAESVTLESAEEIKTMGALYLLPSVLKKKPSVIMGPPKSQSEDTVTPYLEFNCSIFEAKSFIVRAENEIIATTTSFIEGIALLVGTFYVFGMEYPKGAKDVFNFVESCLLQMKNIKPSRCVATSLMKLKT